MAVRVSTRRAAVVAAACVAPLAVAHGQAPAGFDTLSAAAVAESLKVFNDLGQQLHVNLRDAAAQYRRGMIAFALAERSQVKPPIHGLNYHDLRLAAIDALKTARDLDPNNGRYALAIAAYYETDKLILGQSSGRAMGCDTNLDHYKTEADPRVRLDVILHAGWVCWADFDGYENRALSSGEEKDTPELKLGSNAPDPNSHISSPIAPKDAAPASVCGAASKMLSPATCETAPIGDIMLDAIDSVLATLKPLPFDVAGESDYLSAKLLFRAAYDLAPTDPRAFQCLAMVLAAHNDWAELQRLARDHTISVPADPWGWMTVALATYRQQPGKESRGLFDSAFARLAVADRKRLDRLERVLRPKDSVAYLKRDSAGRDAVKNTTWLLADPLWSVPNSDPRTEFLARVTYAELRWSLPDLHIRGADTDRGDVYIRYGPPERIFGETIPELHGMFTFWVYNSDLIFAFDKFLHTGKAAITVEDIAVADRVKAWQPSRWDNIATTRIDSMPTQVARFRSGADSVEMYVATAAPIQAMRQNTVFNVQPVAHYWLYGLTLSNAYIDSLPVGNTGLLQWTRRVPAGGYYLRIESTIPEALIAGRTTSNVLAARDTVTGFSNRGFGLSDVVIAKHAPLTPTARRWNDIAIDPWLGDLTKGAELSLVWENYELGRDGSDAHYDIAVSIEAERSKGGRIAASVLDRLASAVGVETRANKVTMKIERRVPYAPIVPENVAIGLGATPPGAYRMTVQVTDRVSRRASSRTMRVVIK